MSTRGHNENAVRLASLADDAKTGLERVERGEKDTLEGWIAYGAALNEGRSLFLSDKHFGQWIKENLLGQVARVEIESHDRAAAMWAAANADQFTEAKEAGNARTVRGIHAQWKKIEADRNLEAEKAARIEAEEAAKRESEEKSKELERLNAEKELAQKAVRDAGDSAELEKAVERVEETTGRIEQTKREIEETAPKEAPQSKPDQETPDAELRKEFRKLSDEGIEDDWVNMRLEIADLRKQVAAQRVEIEHQKVVIDELSSDNQGKTISKLQGQYRAAKYARDEALTAAKRMEYRLKMALKGEAA